jgi:hypothetical protein
MCAVLFCVLAPAFVLPVGGETFAPRIKMVEDGLADVNFVALM